jgi:gentisate 1,2-dioxygenase
MVPIGAVSRHGLSTPIICYPYERTREALVAASKGEAPDPHWGTTLRYANPIDGGWAQPTLGAWMTYLQRGFTTTPIRSTDPSSPR